MQNDPAFQTVEEDDVQPILLAASEHDLHTLRNLLRGSTSDAANVRDSDTGFTPLHSAIYACAPDSDDAGDEETSHQANEVPTGDSNGTVPHTSESDDAYYTVRYLLQSGAVWDQLDNQNETPGCLASRLGLKKLYEVMVDAGVRAEMLRNRLDEYEPLNDRDSEDEDGAQNISVLPETAAASQETQGHSSKHHESSPGISNMDPSATESPPLGADNASTTRDLEFEKLTCSDSNGTTPAWETSIMSETITNIVPQEGLHVLSIGHGTGVMNDKLQSTKPAAHHIVEAHAEVLSSMRQDGWFQRVGMTVHEGKWQAVIPKLVAEGQVFDAIYFDIHGEEYKSLRTFFDGFVPSLLKDNGRFSFFNAFGADRQIRYDVYAKVVEMDLLESGFDVDWVTVAIDKPGSDDRVAGTKRPLWKLAKYKLPVITSLG